MPRLQAPLPFYELSITSLDPNLGWVSYRSPKPNISIMSSASFPLPSLVFLFSKRDPPSSQRSNLGNWASSSLVCSPDGQSPSLLIHLVKSAQFSSVAQLRLTLCDPMDCSTLGSLSFLMHLIISLSAATLFPGPILSIGSKLQTPTLSPYLHFCTPPPPQTLVHILGGVNF